jgi:hypothetical protein
MNKRSRIHRPETIKTSQENREIRPAKQWLQTGASGSGNSAAIAANQSCKKRQKTLENRQPKLKVGKKPPRSLNCRPLNHC